MPKEICSFKDCNKKLALTSIQCKCEMKFCSAHRYPEDHACRFDFREQGKINLMRYMSTPVIAKKIEVI